MIITASRCMKCVYDNPLTMCREWWDAGRRVGWIGIETLEDEFWAFHHQPIPWKRGRIVGDARAMPAKARGK